MSVETPEKDFDRRGIMRSASTQSKEDSDDFYKAQGYHTCWNDEVKPVEFPLGGEEGS